MNAHPMGAGPAVLVLLTMLAVVGVCAYAVMAVIRAEIRQKEQAEAAERRQRTTGSAAPDPVTEELTRLLPPSSGGVALGEVPAGVGHLAPAGTAGGGGRP